MKKYLPLLLIALINFQHLSAQNNTDTKVLRFGIRAGANFSHMNFYKGVPPVDIRTNWEPGIFVGFLLQVPVVENLTIQPEYLFSQLGGEIKDSKIKYRLNYFSMPVLLKYQFTSKIAGMAGPQLDLLVNAKKDSSGNSSTITHDTEERNFGFTFGMEFQLVKHLAITARYMHGLNHVGIGQRSNVKEFKYEVLQVSVCTRF